MTYGIALHPPLVVPPPEEIRLRNERRQLELRWPDGSLSSITAARLRTACGCAACRRRDQAGKAVQPDPTVSLRDVQPFGASGLRLVFSDGHDRGLYPWRYLLDLARTAPFCTG
ncbi:MAG: gamma-butyrobetaine hydroxylase-like domain-containing protein [Aquisalimonadaceae bacterium]